MKRRTIWRRLRRIINFYCPSVATILRRYGVGDAGLRLPCPHRPELMHHGEHVAHQVRFGRCLARNGNLIFIVDPTPIAVYPLA